MYLLWYHLRISDYCYLHNGTLFTWFDFFNIQSSVLNFIPFIHSLLHYLLSIVCSSWLGDWSSKCWQCYCKCTTSTCSSSWDILFSKSKWSVLFSRLFIWKGYIVCFKHVVLLTLFSLLIISFFNMQFLSWNDSINISDSLLVFSLTSWFN